MMGQTRAQGTFTARFEPDPGVSLPMAIESGFDQPTMRRTVENQRRGYPDVGWAVPTAAIALVLSQVSSGRSRVAETVGWLALAGLVLLSPMPIVAVLILVPAIAVAFVLPPPKEPPPSVAFDLIAAAAVLAWPLAVAAAMTPASWLRTAPCAVLASLVAGPAVRGFTLPNAPRATRLRVIQPLVLLWLAMPVAPLAVLLVATIGSRLAAYQYPVRGAA